MHQTAKNDVWLDGAGVQVPYSRTTKVERMMETKSNSIMKQAKAYQERGLEFKEKVSEVCRKVYEDYLKTAGVDPADRKGHFTWYNFDKSTKIEVNVNSPIKFEDLAVETSKALFEEFLSESLDNADEIIKSMVHDAFQTSRGKLDHKKLLQLISYKGRTKNKLFSQAIEALEKGIYKLESKTYFNIFERNEDGKYEAVVLNFSSL